MNGSYARTLTAACALVATGMGVLLGGQAHATEWIRGMRGADRAPSHPAQQPQPTGNGKRDDGTLALAEQMDLARLVDVAARRLKIDIEYDPAVLKGTVTLRLGAAGEGAGGLTDEQLWLLTNRLLAARGFTTVQLPGRSGVYSVVKVEAAGPMTRILEPASVQSTTPPEGRGAAAFVPGFTSVIYKLQHRSAKQSEDTVKALLSKPGGTYSILGDDLVLITDLAPRVQQVLQVLERIDIAGEPIEVISVPIHNLGAVQMVSVITQVLAKRELVGSGSAAGPIASSANPALAAGGNGGVVVVSGSRAQGDVLVGPDGRSVLVVAPRSTQAFWRDLIASLDKREPIETRSYVPRYFELKEVQRLVEQTLRATEPPGGENSGSPAGSGNKGEPRIVADDLTGTLTVTATAAQHEQVAALIDRLNAVPPEGRRPMRIFKIRNRGVNEVLSILQSLVSTGEIAGDLNPPSPLPDEGARTSGSTVNPTAPSPGQASAAAASSSTAPGRSDTLPPAPDTSAAVSSVASNLSRSEARDIVRHNQAARDGSNHARGSQSSGAAAEISLTADEGTSSIIAVGPPRLLAQVQELIRQLDVRQPQVMVQAMVVSLTDSQTRDLGIELEGQINLSSDSILRLASLFGLSTAGAAIGERVASGAGGTGLLLSPGEFAVVLRALETLNHGRSVSMPQVLVNNNQQASFNSTVEQPYATIINTTDTQARTSFGGTTSAGTVVTAKPQIGQGDYLILDYTVELSAFLGAAASENLPPPKQTNNVASSVTLPDGYTVAVGGLELATEGDNEQRVPFLGTIPILGEAFKNRSKSSSRTRLYVFLRAEVMRQDRFEDLKFVSDTQARAAGIDDGWPVLEPRVIR